AARTPSASRRGSRRAASSSSERRSVQCGKVREPALRDAGVLQAELVSLEEALALRPAGRRGAGEATLERGAGADAGLVVLAGRARGARLLGVRARRHVLGHHALVPVVRVAQTRRLAGARPDALHERDVLLLGVGVAGVEILAVELARALVGQ